MIPAVLDTQLDAGPVASSPAPARPTSAAASTRAWWVSDRARGPTAHWRVEARFGDGARALEVLDAPGGLWLVRPAEDVVELLPMNPTTVFTALVELLPDDDEATGAGHEGAAPGDAG